MKLYCLRCKQFELFDSMLYGQDILAVFPAIFFAKDGSSPPRKKWPVRLWIRDHTLCYLPPAQVSVYLALNPARQAGTRFTYPGGMEG